MGRRRENAALFILNFSEFSRKRAGSRTNWAQTNFSWYTYSARIILFQRTNFFGRFYADFVEKRSRKVNYRKTSKK